MNKGDAVQAKPEETSSPAQARIANMIWTAGANGGNKQGHANNFRISNLRLSPEAEIRLRNNKRVVSSQDGEM